MRTLSTLCLILFTATVARADEAADARAIIDKAIKAAGGAELLNKYKAATFKIKGKISIMGMDIEFTGDMAHQGKDQQKIAIDMEVMGQKLSMTQVFNKTEGWTKLNDQVMDMDKDKIDETMEELHSGWVTRIVPLTDKAFTLATAGETKVNDKPALGVRVSYKGRKDVTLYFDNESYLLVKHEGRAKDDSSGQEVNEETYHEAYAGKEFKQAMKLRIHRDGKPFAEFEMSDMKPEAKLDDSVFAKP